MVVGVPRIPRIYGDYRLISWAACLLAADRSPVRAAGYFARVLATGPPPPFHAHSTFSWFKCSRTAGQRFHRRLALVSALLILRLPSGHFAYRNRSFNLCFWRCKSHSIVTGDQRCILRQAENGVVGMWIRFKRSAWSCVPYAPQCFITYLPTHQPSTLQTQPHGLFVQDSFRSMGNDVCGAHIPKKRRCPHIYGG